MSSRITTLHLCAYNGRVYYRIDGGRTKSVAFNSRAIMANGLSSILPDCEGWLQAQTFVPASPNNARLLCLLHAEVSNLWLTPPIWGSPPVGARPFPVLVASSATAASQIEASLDNRLEVAASLGGQRKFTKYDRATYEISRNKQPVPEWIQRHPGWPLLEFCGAPQETAWVLSLITDPRWYVNLKLPDEDRLMSAFGLGQYGLNNMQHYIDPGQTPARNYEMALSVLDTWYSRSWLREPLPKGLSCRFPWRIYYEASDLALGLLRACRAMLRAVCESWLDNLSSLRVYEGLQKVPRGKGDTATGPSPRRLLPMKSPEHVSRQLFLPDSCFRRDIGWNNQSELQVWGQHVSDWHERFGPQI